MRLIDHPTGQMFAGVGAPFFYKDQESKRMKRSNVQVRRCELTPSRGCMSLLCSSIYNVLLCALGCCFLRSLCSFMLDDLPAPTAKCQPRHLFGFRKGDQLSARKKPPLLWHPRSVLQLRTYAPYRSRNAEYYETEDCGIGPPILGLCVPSP